jgi:hypothetical protein
LSSMKWQKQLQRLSRLDTRLAWDDLHFIFSTIAMQPHNPTVKFQILSNWFVCLLTTKHWYPYKLYTKKLIASHWVCAFSFLARVEIYRSESLSSFSEISTIQIQSLTAAATTNPPTSGAKPETTKLNFLRDLE